jgi:hypothetical protein
MTSVAELRGWAADLNPDAWNDPRARLIVPAFETDAAPWPTLGPEVCDFIEGKLVHGPGDILGAPVTLSDEIRAILYRAYEVYPPGHPRAGRRRFKRVVISRRKGWAKTEVAAWIAIVELDPEGPVRCDGWRRRDDGGLALDDYGVPIPIGRPVRDPYIPMIAFTEEQTSDLAYAGVKAILEEDACALVNDYDTGTERILHKAAPGKLAALAAAPNSRDGARTSFDHRDETHRMDTTRLLDACETMDDNLPKRVEADAWSLATTTMYGPGEGSQAEKDHRWAIDTAAGRIPDAALYFDHLQASERWDFDLAELHRADTAAAIRMAMIDQIRGALIQASGDALSYADLPSIMSLRFLKIGTDENRGRRYWCNQRRRSSRKWTEVTARWPDLAQVRPVTKDAPVVVAFDGSYNRDCTALVGCTVEEVPHVFVIRVWERPVDLPGWRVSVDEVVTAVEDTMETHNVVELCPDPSGWREQVEAWEVKWGSPEPVLRFEQTPSRSGPATDMFEKAVQGSEPSGVVLLTHDGDPDLERHLENCVPVDSRGYRIIRKESVDSPNKIDVAVGAVMAHARARWHYLNPKTTKRIQPFAIWG